MVLAHIKNSTEHLIYKIFISVVIQILLEFRFPINVLFSSMFYAWLICGHITKWSNYGAHSELPSLSEVRIRIRVFWSHPDPGSLVESFTLSQIVLSYHLMWTPWLTPQLSHLIVDIRLLHFELNCYLWKAVVRIRKISPQILIRLSWKRNGSGSGSGFVLKSKWVKKYLYDKISIK